MRWIRYAILALLASIALLSIWIGISTLRIVGEVRDAEAQLKRIVTHPPTEAFEVGDVVRAERIPVRHVLAGRAVDTVPPLQLWVDVGGELDYWKPGYGISARALWTSAQPPRAACRLAATALEIETDQCTHKAGERGWALGRSDLILLEGDAESILMFKRGVYVDLNADDYTLLPFGNGSDTVIQVSASIYLD